MQNPESYARARRKTGTATEPSIYARQPASTMVVTIQDEEDEDEEQQYDDNDHEHQGESAIAIKDDSECGTTNDDESYEFYQTTRQQPPPTTTTTTYQFAGSGMSSGGEVYIFFKITCC